MNYASHPRAVWVLNAIAFAESSFFPLPPDPLYIAMILNKPSSAWRLAFVCTMSSVVGGLLGYAIGYGLYETLGQWLIQTYGMETSFNHLKEQFHNWGFWIVALKGLTPIPYKIVTIASGAAGLDLYTFIVASLIARSFRFYLLAFLLWWGGEDIKRYIDRNLGFLTTVGLLALIAGFIIIKYIF